MMHKIKRLDVDDLQDFLQIIEENGKVSIMGKITQFLDQIDEDYLTEVNSIDAYGHQYIFHKKNGKVILCSTFPFSIKEINFEMPDFILPAVQEEFPHTVFDTVL